MEEIDVMKDSVQEFITAFDAKPDWGVLVQEESKEVLEAVTNLLKEVADLMYVAQGYEITHGNGVMTEYVSPEFTAACKWADLLLSQHELFDIVPVVFARVHASNMSKLGDDGKPIRREDGKVLKGPNYAPPDLSDLVKNI